MPDGVHRIVATYADGREVAVPCRCDWCEVWRAYLSTLAGEVDDFLLSVTPERRPDWLPVGRGEGAPPSGAARFADVRRILTPTGGHYG